MNQGNGAIDCTHSLCVPTRRRDFAVSGGDDSVRRCLDSLFEVGDDIVCVLDADGEVGGHVLGVSSTVTIP